MAIMSKRCWQGQRPHMLERKIERMSLVHSASNEDASWLESSAKLRFAMLLL